MSLIDPKHIAAPFRNTVHLIAILFVVLLFTVYRLATGGVEVAPKFDQTAVESTKPTAAPKQELKLPGINPATADDSMEKLLGHPDGKTQANGDPSDLKDIEKALGLSK